ncbi:MAG: 50S ribosomal protein L15 [Deltaproteobacteria bacterium]|nr:50S ribosomal protein L15 [Deltaproteobacteria bacterium]
MKAPFGARPKRKRVGRGEGSGHGGTSTRGHKGQNARAGGPKGRGFEGGQTPMTRRLPKRGFFNFHRIDYAIVNVGDFKELPANSVVDQNFLFRQGLIKKKRSMVKILGNGDLTVSLVVRAHSFSQSARKKITEAGGQFEVLRPFDHAQGKQGSGQVVV